MAHRIAALTGGFALLALLIIHGPEVTQPAFAVPGNDNFVNAITLTPLNAGGPATTPIIAHEPATAGATTESGEPTPCAPTVTTVWYAWTAPNQAPYTVTFDTFGSNFDTVLAIYTGNSVGALTLVGGNACNDDFFYPSLQSLVSFTFVPNTTYRIQVGGLVGLTGDMILNFVSAADMFVGTPADNNARDSVLSLREALMVANGSLACGTLDALELAAAVNCAGGDYEMIQFLPYAFPVLAPVTIFLGSPLPALSSGNDVVTGVGAGVVVDGQIVLNCIVVTSYGNRIAGLIIQRCDRGIEIRGAYGNRIGIDVFSPNPVSGQRNIFAYNYIGVQMQNVGGSNYVSGNIIGTDDVGTSGLGNYVGVYVVSSLYQNIGLPGVLGRNVISGNSSAGIVLIYSSVNYVQNNYVGTNAGGTAPIPNTTGVVISSGSPFNFIGSTNPAERNLISGNAQHGVLIIGADSIDNEVVGNYIGTNAAGAAALPNGGRGVEIEAPRNTIGGTVPGAGNVISGNGDRGVAFEGAGTTENLVQGNYIGVGANGITAVPNTHQGIWFGSDLGGQTIGGTAPGAGNLIAHNGDHGIGILSNSNSIYGNTVRNNGLDGIYVAGSSNRIGQTAPASTGNVITLNGGDGVSVVSGTGNDIGHNSMIGNGGQGIDLAPDGVTDNDPGDGDGGPNNLQNVPELFSSAVGGGNTVISGSLSSTLEPFIIQFFHSNTCDATGHGEGEVFIGSRFAGGSGTFALTFSFEVPPGRFITATATRDSTLDTSEFSNCIASVNDADDDNDGFTDAAEAAIGTNPWDPCGSNGWPAELTGNDNTLNVGDFNSFLFPLRGNGSFNKFGHPVPDPQNASIARWNLQVDGTINIGDLNALNPAVIAPTSQPPMFGGLPAFFTNMGNGAGGCPFPP